MLRWSIYIGTAVYFTLALWTMKINLVRVAFFCRFLLDWGSGIGAHLLTSVQRYEYDTTSSILIVIIVIVIALDSTFGYLRKWVQ